MKKFYEEYPVIVMVMELNDLSTAKEVTDRVQLWIDQTWYAQLAAFHYVKCNRFAKAEILNRLANREVEEAFLAALIDTEDLV